LREHAYRKLVRRQNKTATISTTSCCHWWRNLSPTTASTTPSFALQVPTTQCPWKEKQRQRHEEDPRRTITEDTEWERHSNNGRKTERDRNAQSLINPKPRLVGLPFCVLTM
jgi:hypothetical protein